MPAEESNLRSISRFQDEQSLPLSYRRGNYSAKSAPGVVSAPATAGVALTGVGNSATALNTAFSTTVTDGANFGSTIALSNAVLTNWYSTGFNSR